MGGGQKWGAKLLVVVVVWGASLLPHVLPLSPSPTSRNPVSGLEDSPLTEVQAVEGDRVLLPCNLEPPLANDSIHLVLFYHDGGGTPIYSLDARSVSLEQASHWAETELGGRAYMELGAGKRGLVLEEVTRRDEGEYRCRVDFVHSPTRNLRVRLHVIVPPRSIAISTDYSPRSRLTRVAGPYPEGSEVTLSCQVLGGHPRPHVTWWNEGALLDKVSEVNTGQVTRNALALPPLTRADLNKTLTCQASNSNLTIPLSQVITIDMTYPPLSVTLGPGSGGVLTVREGVGQTLTCEARGSRPPAKLRWWKDGNVLDLPTKDEVEGDVSRSSVTLVPEARDHGSLVTCRAYSPSLIDQVLSNATTLSVLYKPRLQLSLGPHLSLESVEEGDQVTFTCQVDANPQVTGIQWAQDGVPLQTNSSMGVRVGGDTLLLEKVTRASTGHYTCAAANTEGARTSNPLHLAVMFPPTCSDGQQTVYGAARHEQLHVPCQVQSYPEPTFFRWAVNTSTGVVDVALNLSSNSGRRSVVRYMPQTHHDFGELLCWATNRVGQQKRPCVFRVIPAAKPEAVHGCVAERNSSMPASYVVLTCSPGWDGGLNQTFTLEVRQAAREEVLEAFRHASNPLFIITGLKVGVEYLLTVTAANSRGSSPPVTLNYTATAASADKVVSPHSHTSLLSIMPLLVLLLGTLVAVSACVAVGVLLVRRGRDKRKARAKCLYAGPLKDDLENHDLHTIVCVNRECEKEELMRSTGTAVANLYVSPSTLLNNSSLTPSVDGDMPLREGMPVAPLASLDSLGRCSTPSSTSTSKTTSSASSKSSHVSSATVALNPDYLAKDPEYLMKNPDLLMKHPEYLSRNPDYVIKNPDFMLKNSDYLLKNTDYLGKNADYLIRNPEYLAVSPEYVAPSSEYLSKRTEYMSPSAEFLARRAEYLSQEVDCLGKCRPLLGDQKRPCCLNSHKESSV
ncbi:nephrin-like [Portunus trituberculatus]|uniref:nephrin-like n=1 Tax=Portunus trituberculatus TaxID=210409 RepID=UPI001E1CEFDF|nr:nephrin-like [Portunus trituberculatus]